MTHHTADSTITRRIMLLDHVYQDRPARLCGVAHGLARTANLHWHRLPTSFFWCAAPVMEISSRTFKHATQFSGYPSLAPEGLGLWRHRVWQALNSRWLLSAFSTALVISLLLAFYNVVNQATNQSAFRQQALAAQSQAVWRCKLLPSVSARQAVC